MLQHICIIFSDWVKDVWDSDFTDVTGIDADIITDTDPSFLLNTLQKITDELNNWIDKNDDEEGDKHFCIHTKKLTNARV